MQLSLGLRSIVAALICVAIDILVPCDAAAASNSQFVAGSSAKQRTGLARTATRVSSAVEQVSAVVRGRNVVKFGPEKCISTWRNEDGHCEVATKCKDLKNYKVNLICVDMGGQKVRHKFAAGSFDSEEQFDTLIECKQCLADKEETIEVVQAEKSPSESKAPSGIEKSPSKDDQDTVALDDLRAEVKQLEGFMVKTSKQVNKLNDKVLNENFVPKNWAPDCDKVGPRAAEAALKAAAASLVSHDASHHLHRPPPLRQQAEAMRIRSERRRVLDEGAELDEDFKKERRRARLAAPASMSTAEIEAEERAQQDKEEDLRSPLPRAHPAPRLALSKVSKSVQHRQSEIEDDDRDDEGDEDEEHDDEELEDDSAAIPQDADEYERQEDAD
jgi:hypothetical protein